MACLACVSHIISRRHFRDFISNPSEGQIERKGYVTFDIIRTSYFDTLIRSPM